MLRTPWPFVMLGILCAVICIGCGDDDDDDNNDNNDSADGGGGGSVDIVGTWKLLTPGQAAGAPQVDLTLTIKGDGTWSSTGTFDPFTVTQKGTYKLSGNTITGKTTETKITPELGVPVDQIATDSLADGTVKRDGDTLSFTSTDPTTGQAITTVYKKV